MTKVQITEDGKVLTYNNKCLGADSADKFEGIPREITDSGVYQADTKLTKFVLPEEAHTLSYGALAFACFKNNNLIEADLSSVTQITGRESLYAAFQSCTNLTSLNISNLVSISSISTKCFYEAFAGTSLTHVTFDNLVSIGTSSGASVNGIFNFAFSACTQLSQLSFPKLATVPKASSASNMFTSMLNGVTGCTVHFPSNLRSVIGSWSSVTSGFGGTNTTVLFDLPATT